VNVHKSSRYLNELLESFAMDSVECKSVPNLYLPSTKFNSIHLLRHMASDFATVTTSLRHVLDWSTFVSTHEVDWDYVHEVAHKANMNLFLDAINSICVEYLGYPKDMFPVEKENLNLRDKVSQEILFNTETADRPAGKLSLFEKLRYGSSKTQRMFKNRWKYKIVYKESLWESFATLAVNRLKN